MWKNTRKFFVFSLFAFCLCLIPRIGFCHRVNVFCWVEGNQVKCEAKFTPGGPVKGGEIDVFSQQTGERLLTTKTNLKGQASFPIPKDAIKNHWDLKVVCNAEMGHKNFWVVRSDELSASEPSSGSVEQAAPPVGIAISQKDLEDLISRTMNRELAPIKKELAELSQDRITVQDVLGGLGYILGLAGIAFYILGKKEKSS